MKLKLGKVLFSGVMLFNVLAPTMISAEENDDLSNNVTNEVLKNNEESSVFELRSMDRFVSVENNQFVFNLPDNIEIDDGLYEDVISNISDVNEKIVNNNGTIDPDTKKVSFDEDMYISTLSSEIKYISEETFWWGVRTTYTNSQTNHAVKSLNAAAAQGGLMGYALSYLPIFGQIAGGASAITGGYLGLIGSRMDLANKGNGVILDMTWALAFSVESR